MADAAVRAARDAEGTVVLLDESGGDLCSCTPAVSGVVGAVTRDRAQFDSDSGGEELIEVPLELARRRRGRPRKLRP